LERANETLGRHHKLIIGQYAVTIVKIVKESSGTANWPVEGAQTVLLTLERRAVYAGRLPIGL